MAAACVQIFISYAPEDEVHLQALVRVLRPSVRLQQVQLWSRQDVLAGQEQAGIITQRLTSAQVVVLLLSKDYLANDDCYAEALQVLDRNGRDGACVIAVRLRAFLLAAGDRLGSVQVIPPTHHRPMAELDNPDSAWVQVAGELLAIAHNQTIAAASSSDPALPEVPVGAVDLIGDALFEATLLHPGALGCNRLTQWGALDQLVSDSSRDDLILLPGELDKGHTYFLQRVEKFLRRPPPRHIVAVWWDRAPFPISEEEYHEQLAAALRCPAAALSMQLKRILNHNNLILLHRPVSDKFPCSAEEIRRSLSVFCEWLPRLIGAARDSNSQPGGMARHSVKCLQPIAWPPVSLFRQGIARALVWALGRQWTAVEDWLHPHRAKEFLRAVERLDGTLHVQRLGELASISDDDLRDVCRQAAIPSTRWNRFIGDARRLGPTPEKLLLSLSLLLRDPTLKATT